MNNRLMAAVVVINKALHKKGKYLIPEKKRTLNFISFNFNKHFMNKYFRINNEFTFKMSNENYFRYVYREVSS